MQAQSVVELVGVFSSLKTAYREVQDISLETNEAYLIFYSKVVSGYTNHSFWLN